MTKATTLSSLITAAPGGDRAIAIDGPTSPITGYQPARLNTRFHELFGRPDTTVVCEMEDGAVILFRDMDQLENHEFGRNGIAQVHAVPDLAWQHVKMNNSQIQITDMRASRLMPLGVSTEAAPSRPPLDA